MSSDEEKVRYAVYGFYFIMIILYLIAIRHSNLTNLLLLTIIFSLVCVSGYYLSGLIIDYARIRDELNPYRIIEKRQHEKISQLTEKRTQLQITLTEKTQQLFGIKKYISDLFELKKEKILAAYFEFEFLFDKDEYFSKHDLEKWLSKWKKVEQVVELFFSLEYIEISYYKEMERLSDIYKNGDQIVETRNQKYVEVETRKYTEFFYSLEKKPFSQKQIEAIIIDEHRNLVVAGAGTGKTNTLIGKAAYLIEKGLAKPSEILLLSYGSDSRDEIQNRLNRLNLNVEAKTFHSLGLKITNQEHKPSISELSSDPVKLQNFIDQKIEQHKTDPIFLKNLNQFFHNQPEYKSLWEFTSMGDYNAYLKENKTRSLQGEQVKSLEELEIANYLYTNKINYQYDAPYRYQTTTKEHAQYTTDFYLPDYNIYIEYFEIDEEDNTAPFVPREKFFQDIEWKRLTHAHNHTTLIETYSYEKRNNKLLLNLREKLEKHNVQHEQREENEIFIQLKKIGKTQPISGIISTFLNLQKSSNTPLELLWQKADLLENKERNLAFLKIYSKISEEYTRRLEQEKTIDFNDMLNKSADLIERNKTQLNIRYILVDEFQDISQSKNRVLIALLKQNPDCKLFCVGDDWQSIYRITGSDLNIMTNFEDYHNPSKTLYLNETFRLNNMINDFTTKFILQNPKQIIKKLISREKTETPRVTLIKATSTEDAVNSILDKIALHSASVFIISRHSHQFEIPKKEYPNLSIEYFTAHKSKGTQADYVIILGLDEGIHGFPCEIADDRVLNLVLSKKMEYPHSEERRLFYVAATRAKKHVYLVFNEQNPSSFIKEILRGDYPVNIEADLEIISGECPICSGDMVLEEDDYGSFYSCSNYPYCDYRPSRCNVCVTGYLLLKGEYYECTNCKDQKIKCPKCSGYQVSRDGSDGRFYGCSNYPECDYIRRVQG